MRWRISASDYCDEKTVFEEVSGGGSGILTGAFTRLLREHEALSGGWIRRVNSR